MPTVTRWSIRTGLLLLAAAMVVGMLQVVPGAGGLPYPSYLHLITVGWLSNLIFGVAHWMFPRASAEHPRGDERLAWAGWGLLNAGLLCRLVGESFPLPGVLLLSAVLQLLAVWVWAGHLWSRVKGK
jgi:hypothetical protein